MRSAPSAARRTTEALTVAANRSNYGRSERIGNALAKAQDRPYEGDAGERMAVSPPS
ncbi:hypothethical protein [Ralstonia solanacearum PSI07]|nr:hypothethical protein [Ralstonia solanacearum PSI07]